MFQDFLKQTFFLSQLFELKSVFIPMIKTLKQLKNFVHIFSKDSLK